MRHDIYTMDMDGTLCKEICFTPEECLNATPVPSVIKKTEELFLKNFVIIYTARTDELMSATFAWLTKHGVRYHAVSNKKIPAKQYIDDLALNVRDL